MRTSLSMLSVLAIVWLPSDELAAAGSSGSGTLALGDEEFRFDVVRCNAEGESDQKGEPTLFGQGKTEDGKSFRIFGTRFATSGMVMHNISLQISGGEIYEASRGSNGRTWIGVEGDDNAPLVVVDGSGVRATGMFVLNPNPAEKPGMEGHLEAACK